MLNSSLLNPSNYAHVGSYPIPKSGELTIPARTELSDTMMIRWTINHLARNADFTQLGSGLLISEIWIDGYGVLESQTFDIPPSNFTTKRVQLVNLDLEVPQKLIFKSQSSDVLNSVLEFYAYVGKEETVYQTYHTEYMPTNNPSTFDPAALTAAVVAASPALAQATAAATQQVAAATLAAQDAAESARSTIDSKPTIKAWTGNPNDHVIVADSPNRLETKIFNQHNQRMYLAFGKPGNKTFENYTEILEPNGSYISTDEERLLPLLVYLAANKPPGQASIAELMP